VGVKENGKIGKHSERRFGKPTENGQHRISKTWHGNGGVHLQLSGNAERAPGHAQRGAGIFETPVAT